MSAAEKLNELWLEHERLSHSGVISHNPERVMDALLLIVAVVEAMPALLDCPNLDAPYHTSLNCNFCSAAPVREGRAVLAELDAALT
jgi:hypothetical protein